MRIITFAAGRSRLLGIDCLESSTCSQPLEVDHFPIHLSIHLSKSLVSNTLTPTFHASFPAKQQLRTGATRRRTNEITRIPRAKKTFLLSKGSSHFEIQNQALGTARAAELVVFNCTFLKSG
jgi:hypothetical protein